MNYLISAYCLSPYIGSEAAVGWNWVLQYEKNYKPGDNIVVITKKCYEKDTLKGFDEYKIKHVKLVAVDVPKYLNWYREKYSIFHHLYYIMWQHFALKWAKSYYIHFDFIHHVTMGDYRIPSQFCKYKNAKVVFGPIGGAQITPKSLQSYEKNIVAAKFREFINITCLLNPFYKNKIKKFYRVYPSNPETLFALEKVTKKKLTLVNELGIRDDFKCLPRSEKSEEKCIIIYVGKLLVKKGLIFLFEALEYLPHDFSWELRIYGNGQDKEKILSALKQCKVSDKIKYYGEKDYIEIGKAYQEGDIFVMPSLRETGGNVLIEAMAHSLPIVAFNNSFCKILNENGCGIFIDSTQKIERIKRDFADALLKLGTDRNNRDMLATNAYVYVNENLTWEKKFDVVVKQNK